MFRKYHFLLFSMLINCSNDLEWNNLNDPSADDYYENFAPINLHHSPIISPYQSIELIWRNIGEISNNFIIERSDTNGFYDGVNIDIFFSDTTRYIDSISAQEGWDKEYSYRVASIVGGRQSYFSNILYINYFPDCNGVINGESLIDNCGNCDDDENNDCVKDCEGEWGGVKVEDCTGDCGGSAMPDECGDCNGNNAAMDCAGDCNGGGLIGTCGVCVEGETSKLFNECDSLDINSTSKAIIIQLGDQKWMKQNLSLEPLGEDIDSYFYNDEENNMDEYGLLYYYDVIEDICPIGFHVPTLEEWEILYDTLNFYSVSMLSEYIIVDGMEQHGFFAKLGGYKKLDNYNYYQLDNEGYYWTSTQDELDNSYYGIKIKSGDNDSIISGPANNYGFISIRCIMD